MKKTAAIDDFQGHNMVGNLSESFQTSRPVTLQFDGRHRIRVTGASQTNLVANQDSTHLRFPRPEWKALLPSGREDPHLLTPFQGDQIQVTR